MHEGALLAPSGGEADGTGVVAACGNLAARPEDCTRELADSVNPRFSGAGGGTRTPNLLFSSQRATVHGVLACAVLAGRVRRVVQAVRPVGSSTGRWNDRQNDIAELASAPQPSEAGWLWRARRCGSWRHGR